VKMRMRRDGSASGTEGSDPLWSLLQVLMAGDYGAVVLSRVSGGCRGCRGWVDDEWRSIRGAPFPISRIHCRRPLLTVSQPHIHRSASLRHRFAMTIPPPSEPDAGALAQTDTLTEGDCLS
jgi:hypothetical protein